MRPDLLPHEARPIVLLLGQAGVVDVAMLLMMNGDVWWRGGALSAQCGLNWSSGSQHSMSSTCVASRHHLLSYPILMHLL
jgi:hypothetical protein